MTTIIISVLAVVLAVVWIVYIIANRRPTVTFDFENHTPFEGRKKIL